MAEAERWAAEQGDNLTAPERSFLETCVQSRRRRKSRSIGLLLGALVSGLLVYSVDWYVRWRNDQPWAYMTDLITGAAYPLQGDAAWIGRAAEMGNIRYAVDVHSQVVSRLHFLIYRNRRALDTRSLNGTTVNAQLLPYGYEMELNDGDLIALAGAALFSFTPVEPPLFPFAQRREPRFPLPPTGTWAILIDGASKKIIPLIREEYFLDRQDGKSVTLSTTKDPKSVLRIIRERDNEPAIVVLKQDAIPLATIKFEDRFYLAIKLPVETNLDEFFKEEQPAVEADKVSGAEYISKVSLCISENTVPMKFSRLQLSSSGPLREVALEEGDNVPDCIVGPLQIIALR